MKVVKIHQRLIVSTQHLDEINGFLNSFFEFFAIPDKETGLTGFDASLNNLAEVTAKTQANIIVASMRGNISGAVRGAESALEEQAFEDNPLQAAIMQALPKKLARNAPAQMAVMKIVENVISSGGGHGQRRPAGGGNNGSHVHKSDFNLGT